MRGSEGGMERGSGEAIGCSGRESRGASMGAYGGGSSCGIGVRGGGGVRPPSPPRHDTTAPEEPFCARGSIRLSLLLYFFIMNF